MSNNEAKFLLTAYRPNGRDAGDPAMAEALAQARNDPTLGEWFSREQAYDSVVAARLREIAAPAGLRESIVAGARASAPPAELHRAGWLRPAWVAVAAAAVVLLSVAGWWRWSPVDGGTLNEFAVNFVSRGFILEKRSADVRVLQAWLAERHGPLPSALPAEFAHLRALGCRQLEFQGHEISLVCFERDGKEFHVFVAQRSDFPGLEPHLKAEFGETAKFASAAWSDASNYYVLVSDAGLDVVKRIL